jgi:hypothetical protein
MASVEEVAAKLEERPQTAELGRLVRQTGALPPATIDGTTFKLPPFETWTPRMLEALTSDPDMAPLLAALVRIASEPKAQTPPPSGEWQLPRGRDAREATRRRRPADRAPPRR